MSGCPAHLMKREGHRIGSPAKSSRDGDLPGDPIGRRQAAGMATTSAGVGDAANGRMVGVASDLGVGMGAFTSRGVEVDCQIDILPTAAESWLSRRCGYGVSGRDTRRITTMG